MAKTMTAARLDRGRAFGLIGLLLTALVLNSCNTVEGAGEDVSAVGGAVSDTADDVKDNM